MHACRLPAIARLPLLLALLAPLLGLAQAPSAPASDGANSKSSAGSRPGSGDAWIDRQLDDIDAYAQRYPDSFLDEVARYAGVPRGYVQALLQQRHWRAGDIYFACFWAYAMNLSCRQVVQAWSQDHADGWEGVVERLPVQPDNLHYRALRHAIVASYDRWDRPIVLDATLQRQLGDRAQRHNKAVEAAEVTEAADKARLR